MHVWHVINFSAGHIFTYIDKGLCMYNTYTIEEVDTINGSSLVMGSENEGKSSSENEGKSSCTSREGGGSTSSF